MTEVETTDVLVIGAGMGGIAAAVAAQEDGARVILVEKAREPGGAFALSGGYVWTVPTFDLYREIVPEGDPALGRILVDDFEPGVEWLREHGVRFGPRRVGWFTRGAGEGYRIEPDPVSAGVQPLLAAFEGAGGTLRCGRPGRSLLYEDDRVVGAILGGPGGPHTVRANAVVIATGGFQGDVELVTRYIGRWADRMYLRSCPTNTGDGLRMALGAGAAASRGLHAFYGHLLPAAKASVDPGAFRGASQYYSSVTVALNLLGQRFADESRGDDMTNQALAHQPEALGFLVFDEACYREHVLVPYVPDGAGADPMATVPAAGGVVLQAGSLADLTAQLAPWGVSPTIAQATLEQFDAAMAAGRPASLPVPRRAKHYRVCTPPFYAIPVKPGLTFTNGGVRIDTASRALDRDGRPVPGLFVAGIDAGGIFYEGYVGALASGLVTGLRAGIHAARSG